MVSGHDLVTVGNAVIDFGDRDAGVPESGR